MLSSCILGPSFSFGESIADEIKFAYLYSSKKNETSATYCDTEMKQRVVSTLCSQMVRTFVTYSRFIPVSRAMFRHAQRLYTVLAFEPGSDEPGNPWLFSGEVSSKKSTVKVGTNIPALLALVNAMYIADRPHLLTFVREKEHPSSSSGKKKGQKGLTTVERVVQMYRGTENVIDPELDKGTNFFDVKFPLRSKLLRIGTVDEQEGLKRGQFYKSTDTNKAGRFVDILWKDMAPKFIIKGITEELSFPQFLFTLATGYLSIDDAIAYAKFSQSIVKNAAQPLPPNIAAIEKTKDTMVALWQKIQGSFAMFNKFDKDSMPRYSAMVSDLHSISQRKNLGTLCATRKLQPEVAKNLDIVSSPVKLTMPVVASVTNPVEEPSKPVKEKKNKAEFLEDLLIGQSTIKSAKTYNHSITDAATALQAQSIRALIHASLEELRPADYARKTFFNKCHINPVEGPLPSLFAEKLSSNICELVQTLVKKTIEKNPTQSAEALLILSSADTPENREVLDLDSKEDVSAKDQIINNYKKEIVKLNEQIGRLKKAKETAVADLHRESGALYHVCWEVSTKISEFNFPRYFFNARNIWEFIFPRYSF